MLSIIKLGGAAFTDKSNKETLNDESFEVLLHALAALPSPLRHSVILIHGAGSFGHFEAKKYSLQQGIVSTDSQEGIALCRQSVTKLNGIVISKLIERGLPAVGVSPFGTWEADDGKVSKHSIPAIRYMLDKGLMPVLHGDVVMDNVKGCCILSGDTLAEMLAIALRPNYVVFVTDVAGVYDMPPHLPNAKLLHHISVEPSRSTSNIGAEAVSSQDKPTTSSGHEHDVTGGMTQKLSSANTIAASGIPVYIINRHVANLINVMNAGEPPEVGTVLQCMVKS